MVRTKSAPRRYTRYGCESQFTNWNLLPYDVRKLIFEYTIPDVDTFFNGLDRPIRRSDPNGFYYTGGIRFRMVDQQGRVTYGNALDDDIDQRSLRPGVRVERHMGDIRQRAMWRSYGKIVFGSKPLSIAKALDSASWESPGPRDQSSRLDEDASGKKKKARAENQRVLTISQSDCSTHTFYIGLVGEKKFPTDPVLYRTKRHSYFFDDSSEDGEGCDEGDSVRSTNGRTHEVERWGTGGGRSTESFSGYETDSEYSSEYDSDTGEKIKSIRLRDYDELDRLFYRKTTQRVPRPYKSKRNHKPRVPNAHLKNEYGVTVFQPISWRLSVNPTWKSKHNSGHAQLWGDESMVIGRRHRFVDDELDDAIADLWEDGWTTWDDEDIESIVCPNISLFQYYHIGIVDAFDKEPSFTELCFDPNQVVIPLLEEADLESGFGGTLIVSHYTLYNGLKCKAEQLSDIDINESIVDDQTVLYI